MKTIYLSLLFLLLKTVSCYGQIGINTTLPQAIFHVDGKNDNANTNVKHSQKESNDIVVTNNGNIGIGILNPTNKLEIKTNDSNTGLSLLNASSQSKVLISDKDGNATWSFPERKARTSIYSITGVSSLIGNIDNMAKYDKFLDVKIEDVKGIFGDQYGWDIVKQQYIVPIKGIYRISMSIYLESGLLSDYYKIGISKGNNAKQLMPNMPYISIVSEEKDKLAYVTGLAILNKDDILEIKVANQKNPNSPVKIIGGPEYSTLLIELVKQIR
ncbi:hypothetical protein [Myroides sp. C4067]|uniref:hypothetical protein n=1 Tax=Myroides sp. C4067 TaxID=3136765 RepID=UPI003101652C